MRIANFTDVKKDKIEEVKQTKKETQFVFNHRIKPHRNHTLFFYNLKTKEMGVAKFEEVGALKWEDAVKGFISPNKKIIIEQNCIYESCLNKQNFIRILNKKHGIKYEN